MGAECSRCGRDIYDECGHCKVVDDRERLRVALAGAGVELREASERMREAGGGGFTEGELRRAADVVDAVLASKEKQA